MEIFLSKNNNDYIKVFWKERFPEASASETFSVNAENVRIYSKNVRDILTELNDYARKNPERQEFMDPDWTEYSDILDRLRAEGRLLRAALINAGTPRDVAKDFADAIRDMTPDEAMTIQCTDQDVTIPFGFLFEGPRPARQGRPSRVDFNGFWINRFVLNLKLGGTKGVTAQALEPSELKAIYALHQDAKDEVLSILRKEKREVERQRFDHLTTIDQHDHYAWDAVRAASEKVSDQHALYFVFAHSDGVTLQLANKDKCDWTELTSLLGGRNPKRNGLVVLNCCTSMIGHEGNSLLSAIKQKGICGVIGTEAEVMNHMAFRCGISLLWKICEGKKLGDAFSEMQSDDELFPINLLYSCYAARDFRLSAPIKFPLNRSGS